MPSRFDNNELKITEDDLKWYNNNIPNSITRNKAIKIHKNLTFDKLQNNLWDNKTFGTTYARKKGGKKLMTMLSALHETEATSLVAVCDELTGFFNPSRIGEPQPVPTGSNCDLYLNGKKMASVNKVEGINITKNNTKKWIIGAIRDHIVVEPGIQIDEFGSRFLGRESVDSFSGEVKLSSSLFGKGKHKIKGSHLIDVNHKVVSENQDKTFPCRDDKEFKCVNWVKFMTKSEVENEKYKFFL